MKSLTTKLVMSTLGIAMLATPALAQRPHHQFSHLMMQVQSPVNNDVISAGRDRGTDPDANVRLELRREPGDWGPSAY